MRRAKGLYAACVPWHCPMRSTTVMSAGSVNHFAPACFGVAAACCMQIPCKSAWQHGGESWADAPQHLPIDRPFEQALPGVPVRLQHLPFRASLCSQPAASSSPATAIRQSPPSGVLTTWAFHIRRVKYFKRISVHILPVLCRIYCAMIPGSGYDGGVAAGRPGSVGNQTAV